MQNGSLYYTGNEMQREDRFMESRKKPISIQREILDLDEQDEESEETAEGERGE